MRRALALVFSNPADIELELAAAIEREESEVTSGLSAFPVQMNKAVLEEGSYYNPAIVDASNASAIRLGSETEPSSQALKRSCAKNTIADILSCAKSAALSSFT